MDMFKMSTFEISQTCAVVKGRTNYLLCPVWKKYSCGKFKYRCFFSKWPMELKGELSLWFVGYFLPGLGEVFCKEVFGKYDTC